MTSPLSDPLLNLSVGTIKCETSSTSPKFSSLGAKMHSGCDASRLSLSQRCSVREREELLQSVCTRSMIGTQRPSA